jgi:hypothetical protein
VSERGASVGRQLATDVDNPFGTTVEFDDGTKERAKPVIWLMPFIAGLLLEVIIKWVVYTQVSDLPPASFDADEMDGEQPTNWQTESANNEPTGRVP